ncbi:GNAT family N-acetyltransferase [Emticicia agri]|uniref:GNAT family N-acetyltransferase n=1 Tax=Emticicia agri TaxID=2492393 RepID=A0A4Q5LX49_9BACT|nr:GNAT family N-acetyltransferase [Emticicia agri]RYU94117.1 GNAT family N-acetyltransferase [Emticicia agri]
MKLVYKVCSKEDIPQLVAIATQSYQEHYTHLWTDGGKNYMKNSFNEEQFLKEIVQPNSIFFLVIIDNLPVGLVKLNIDKAVDDYSANEALELERIYFLKNASGKGLGKETLLMITAFAKDRNKKIIWLKAMKGGNAEAFYQKQGFDVIGETLLDYPFIRAEHTEMVIMSKKTA